MVSSTRIARHRAVTTMVALFFLLPLFQVQYSLGFGIKNATTTHHAPSPFRCLAHEAAVLLKMKLSLSSYDELPKPLPSWQVSTDCCHNWMGVTCDYAGRVIALNLSFGLVGFLDNVPTDISRLNNLVSLDLSGHQSLMLPEPSFQTIIANLSNLKELRLDGVLISSTAAECSKALAKSVSQLQILTMSICGLSGPIDSALSRLGSLTVIDLSGNNITFPDFFAHFPLLRVLSLDGNPLSTFPLGILQLRYLEILSLLNTDLSGFIPYYIGNLTSLTELYLGSGNIFFGRLPATVSNLTSLRTLDCNSYGLSGEINVIANLTQLEFIDLSCNNFTGPIHFGDKVKLVNLEFLDLSYNLLTQTIPAYLFTYPALKALDLSRNQFSGVLEEIPNESRTLTSVYLSDNHLSGPVPRSFARFTGLEILSIDYNNFSGTLHLSSYFRLRNLTLLSASNNKLLSAAWNASGADISSSNNISASSSWLGSYPSDTYMATSLSLVLSSCNVTKLPFTVQQIPQLDTLDLSCNHIQGEIPSWIWKLDSLNLSHNMFTEIAQPPASAKLSSIDLSYNMLSGAAPLPSTGTILDYSHNKFTSIPSRAFSRQFRFAHSINLANNEIVGPVPHAKCHHGDNLRILDLSNNNFSGPVPSYLFNCNSLAVLRLRENNLTGAWPDSIKKGCTLRLIDMHGNQITGRMPKSLTNCQGLEFLDVGKNSIVDSFPFWLGELNDLFILVLRTNLLHGTLLNPKEENLTINHFQNLQIIDLAQNNFDGALPENLFKNSRPMTNPTIIGDSTLAAEIPRTESVYRIVVEIAMKEVYINVPKVLLDLVVIDVSENRFSGLIPKKYGNLTALHVLNMSHNTLTGDIPHELSHLTRLESLDLSWNMLTGEIPPELAISLTSLEWLNLSYNNLSGRIPSGPQFSTFPSSTFQGNKRLYGCPLPVQCNLMTGPPPSKAPATTSVPPSSASKSRSDKFEVIVLFLFIGSGVGVGFAATIVVLRQISNKGRWWHKIISFSYLQ